MNWSSRLSSDKHLIGLIPWLSSASECSQETLSLRFLHAHFLLDYSRCGLIFCVRAFLQLRNSGTMCVRVFAHVSACGWKHLPHLSRGDELHLEIRSLHLSPTFSCLLHFSVRGSFLNLKRFAVSVDYEFSFEDYRELLGIWRASALFANANWSWSTAPCILMNTIEDSMSFWTTR